MIKIMCELCNGTHVVHEITSLGYRTSCCPVCGPESDEEWYARINAIRQQIEEIKMRGAVASGTI